MTVANRFTECGFNAEEQRPQRQSEANPVFSLSGLISDSVNTWSFCVIKWFRHDTDPSTKPFVFEVAVPHWLPFLFRSSCGHSEDSNSGQKTDPIDTTSCRRVVFYTHNSGVIRSVFFGEPHEGDPHEIDSVPARLLKLPTGTNSSHHGVRPDAGEHPRMSGRLPGPAAFVLGLSRGPVERPQRFIEQPDLMNLRNHAIERGVKECNLRADHLRLRSPSRRRVYEQELHKVCVSPASECSGKEGHTKTRLRRLAELGTGTSASLMYTCAIAPDAVNRETDSLFDPSLRLPRRRRPWTDARLRLRLRGKRLMPGCSRNKFWFRNLKSETCRVSDRRLLFLVGRSVLSRSRRRLNSGD